jgi:hypothetical protein
LYALRLIQAQVFVGPIQAGCPEIDNGTIVTASSRHQSTCPTKPPGRAKGQSRACMAGTAETEIGSQTGH